ncbi:ABC transporter substrate-binding protein [Chelatococcus reniformis]|uniref:ABC transporter substrate-binding protein n=1 Tax=Chelatococcus reniformis TaxID=1494448 RepID=A0A916TZ27_9HYPH|nr:ABC transporter substrate-binding protein [Chelatococcus reniformis]GGC53594.1 ABC transporter substrate-binding protein [Chelatococcus reniformis]
MKRREFLGGTIAAGATMVGLRSGMGPALAQGRSNVIRVLLEDGPNTFDPAGTGYNTAAVSITWNVYDRLVSFASAPIEGEPGAFTYDYGTIVGQAAESYTVSPDGRSITFKLRPGATFHDGSPVTAADVKWSLDRCMTVPTAKAQLGTGSLRDPAQFVVIDDMTIRVDTEKADRFTLPNLAIVFPAIFNSKLAKQHATDSDPWAQEWLKTNTAGGGPFKLASYQAGQQFVLERFADWKNGPIESQARILCQVVPIASSRRAAAQRGEADIVRGLAGRDIESLLAGGKTRVLGIPNPNGITFIAMNTQLAPFDNVKVRQAMAYATPYQQMFESVLYKRGRALFGGSASTDSTAWPTPLPYVTDLAKAKALLAEAGLGDGFETTFSIDAGDAALSEPMGILMQEALGKVGVKASINKVPAGQMGTLQAEKKLAMFIGVGNAWLRNPDYFFRVFYNGASRWNYGNFKNAEMEKLVAETRFESDPAVYAAKVQRMIEIAKADVPMITLWSPFQDTALSKAMSGYTYMFHNALELRHLTKA